ncbi:MULTISPECIES: AAA family ATPase [unclassified Campylobacter]|uniref:AAA family ATPase n=1 Tax=unclassified Campylobacter TaxID=2593542 RepID=UPI001BDB3592|nr:MULTISPECIES: AAA family ATPase [unclassified Campylobacter]MBT0880607.1 AAA family ATPase [Campylobacter sp. 2018MI27]MBT0885206.1 AAA family ATPase [Campylobacter sp. 2018MI10]
MKERILKMKKDLSFGLVGKDEIINLSILCFLAGESVFYYGPPGTAKSLVARRISNIFKDANYFEYLMNRFSTPEEVFGPLSLTSLKNDELKRQIEGFLPTSNVVFLDEIWKSSPAILNTLLTIINEKIYKNGKDIIDVPLLGLIAASNEFPDEGEGLEALYDRFLMRLVVPRLTQKRDLTKLLNGNEQGANVDIANAFSLDELKMIKENSLKVRLGKEVIDAIIDIKKELSKIEIDVSERRLLKAIKIIKTSVYLSGRDEVICEDLELLKHCFWTNLDDIKSVSDIIDKYTKSEFLKNANKSIELNSEFYKYINSMLVSKFPDIKSIPNDSGLSTFYLAVHSDVLNKKLDLIFNPSNAFSVNELGDISFKLDMNSVFLAKDNKIIEKIPLKSNDISFIKMGFNAVCDKLESVELNSGTYENIFLGFSIKLGMDNKEELLSIAKTMRDNL